MKPTGVPLCRRWAQRPRSGALHRAQACWHSQAAPTSAAKAATGCEPYSQTAAASWHCFSTMPLVPRCPWPLPGMTRHQSFSTSVVTHAARPSEDSRSPQVSTSTAQPSQQPQQQQPQQPKAVRYSPLHYNVLDFCAKVVPTEDEHKYKQQIVDLIRSHARKAMLDAGRKCDVQVFGSFATGLSTWSSDVDLVVTGVMEPDRHSGVYDISDRGRVVGRLRRIGEALRACKKLDNPRISIIPRARIPIIKLKVRNVHVDISMSDETGPRAARYMAQQVRAYPPMRPLVLVLKAYLRDVGLNEVMYGGLSSYSLCNMVVAHLQEELKAGRDIYDLGEVLYAFLLRYGEEFDYGHDAVSVESGGIVPKQVLGMATDLGRSMYGNQDVERYMERLAVDCPITGRDVSNGSYRVAAVRDSFRTAARRLEALARGRKVSDTSVNYLQALFDVDYVTRRSTLSERAGLVQLQGRGTSPEIIQLDSRGRGFDDDEEELLGGDDDLAALLEATSDLDSLTDSEVEALIEQPPGQRGPRGKRGGPGGRAAGDSSQPAVCDQPTNEPGRLSWSSLPVWCALAGLLGSSCALRCAGQVPVRLRAVCRVYCRWRDV